MGWLGWLIQGCLLASWSQPLSVEQRAIKILKENPLIDGHNDLAIKVRAAYDSHINAHNFTALFENGGLAGQVDLPSMKKGHYGGAFWSAFYLCPKDIFDFSPESYDPIVRATLQQLDLYHRLAARYPDIFTPTPDAATAEHNFAHGKLISPLAIEGLHQVGTSYSNLRLYHALGVRYATLTWNCHNPYADAAVLTFLSNASSRASTPYWGGVSNAGRKLILEMNRLGMLVDLSHVSKDTMLDVLVGAHNASSNTHHHHDQTILGPAAPDPWTGSLAPPIFSHSSAYALCPHPRNVPDDVLRLVKRRNSLVMVNFSPDFVSCTAPPRDAPPGALPDFYPPNSTLRHVVRHIRHIGELIGYDHVGLGTDYDGIESTPRGLEDVSKFPDLVAEMLRSGISDFDAAKVVGRNLLRVWAEVDRVSARLKKEMLPAEDEHVGFPN